MKAIILTVAVAALLQIVAGSLFTGYMVDKLGVVMEQQTESLRLYVDDKEVSTRLYVDQQDRELYNAMQVQFSDERNSLQAFIDRRIDLRINQAIKGGNQ